MSANFVMSSTAMVLNKTSSANTLQAAMIRDNWKEFPILITTVKHLAM